MRNKLKETRFFLVLCVWMLSAFQIAAQEIQIKGKVKDASTGDFLPGVNIIVKGTTQGVSSDINGNFQLSATKGATLVFTFIGYKPYEVTVENSQTLSISLDADVAKLDEVVVIGYGSVKKNDLTGSVDVVSSKDFRKGVVTSPQDLLIGKASGVVITSGNGEPGSAATIRIRGGSSMSASNDPLIVIDGVPVDNNGVSGLTNPLATINPNDIETFTVLKDASATAIYGARASNGVILITTKKGGSKMKINYTGTVSLGTLPSKLEVFSGDEFRALINERFTDDTIINKLGTANTDWQSQVYRTALTHDHNLNISGTTNKTPYRASVGYTNQNGIIKTSNIERYTLALKANPSLLNDNLKLDINLKGSYTNSTFIDNDAIGAAVSFDPTQPVRNNGPFNKGYYTWLLNGAINTNGTDNPVALLDMTNNGADVYRSIGNIQTDYKFPFLPEMRANLNLAYDISTTDGKTYAENGASWTDLYNYEGYRETYSQNRKMQLLDFYLNYTKDLNFLKSKIDVTGGYSWQHFYAKSSNKIWYGTISDSIVTNPKPFKTQNYLLSFFGRVNYSIMDKYLLTLTVRNDGSSRFYEHWGLFPSMAFAWKIKNESFLANVNAISDLKLRLGYGVTGQQDIRTNDYPYMATYMHSLNAAARYQLDTTFYNLLRPSGYDKYIMWESTETFNIGLDFGFFNNRLTGAIDYYFRKTNDLLNNLPVPAGSNLINELITNVGNLENKGIELSLDAKIIAKKDFLWEVGYNISYNENKVTKLTFNEDSTYAGAPTGGISSGISSYIQINSVGYPINSFYVYKQVYDNTGMPIEGLYVDLNEDGIINNSDLYRYKKAAPDILMGISSRITYKNWDFAFSGRLSLNNYVYNNVTSGNATYASLYQSNFLSNTLKKVNETNFAQSQSLSDYYVENGSYFRMDNISLGYRFDNFANYNFSLYIGGAVQNAFVVTKYSGLDPEVSNGIDNNFYPRPRTFLLNLSLDF